MKSVLLSLLLLGASLTPAVAAAQAMSPTLTKAATAGAASSEPAVSTDPPSIVAETTLSPPAPIQEAEPSERPRHGVWTPGYWGWEGDYFVWHEGRVRAPPEAGMRWVEPRWMARSNGWALTSGGWTSEPVVEPREFVAQPGRAHASSHTRH